jgi:hypothetical protein
MTQNARTKMSFRAGIRGNVAQQNVLNNANNQTGHSAIQHALKMNFQNSPNANNSNSGQNFRGQNIQNVGGNKNAAGQDLNDINIKINTAKASTRKFIDTKQGGLGGSILGAL